MCIATINVRYETRRKANDSQWDYGTLKNMKDAPFVIGNNDSEDGEGSINAAQKADLLAVLICRLYGNAVKEGRSVPMSNIRLFTLVFLFDWGCMIRGASPFTSAEWQIGRACAYPFEYYDYFAKKGLLKSDFEKSVWCGDSRVLCQVSFDIQKNQTSFSDKHVEAAQSVLNLAQRVAKKHGVDFLKSALPTDGNVTSVNDPNNEFDSQGRFRRIDEELLNYMLALDPFLDNFAIGKKLDIRSYAKRHFMAYRRTIELGNTSTMFTDSKSGDVAITRKGVSSTFEAVE